MEAEGCSVQLTIHKVNPGGFAIKNILKLNSNRLPGRRPAPGLALWLTSIISANSNYETSQGFCFPAGCFPKSGDKPNIYMELPVMKYETERKFCKLLRSKSLET